MFMSKDMFDDDPRQTGNGSMIVPPSRPQTAQPQSQPQSYTAINTNANTNLSNYDDNGQALTPAMRKAKMEELRQQQIGKRKGRMLVPTTVARQDRPMSASTTNTSTANSGSSFTAYGSNSGSGSGGSRPTTGSLVINNTSSNNSAARPATSYSTFTRSSALSMIDDQESKREYDNHAAIVQSYGGGGKKASEAMIQAGIAPVFDPNPVKDYATTNANVSAANTGDLSSPNARSSVVNGLSIVSLSPLALRLFLTSPTPPGQYHQCYIVRNKKGIANRLYPHYECIYETGEKFLMIAKKKSKNKTSNYLISTDRDKTDKGDDEYLGKIRSNFVGTEFNLYDDGENPAKKQEGLRKTKRAELGTILYESNILGSKGPRKMTVIAPSVKSNKDSKFVPNVHRPNSNDPADSLLQAYQNGASPSNFLALVNKTPKWNDQVGAYVLNFNGRVTMASVKNFQLMVHKDTESDSHDSNNGNDSEESGEEERPVLQFGRVGKDTFTMDFGFPLSPLQAFGICLSSFDSKLACE